MTDRYLIPAPGGQWLALTREQFQQALADAAELIPTLNAGMPHGVQADVALLTAEQMAERTGVEASWYLTRARLNEIPHVRLGKYVRFDPAQVFASGARSPDTRIGNPRLPSNPLIEHSVSGPVSKPVTTLGPVKEGRTRG